MAVNGMPNDEMSSPGLGLSTHQPLWRELPFDSSINVVQCQHVPARLRAATTRPFVILINLERRPPASFRTRHVHLNMRARPWTCKKTKGI